MTVLNASQARIPPDTFNRVAYRGERVRVCRRHGPAVVIVSEEDAALLEALEDRADVKAAKKTIAEMRAQGQHPISWKKIKAKLGL